jgi:hypothetical protein
MVSQSRISRYDHRGNLAFLATNLWVVREMIMIVPYDMLGRPAIFWSPKDNNIMTLLSLMGEQLSIVSQRRAEMLKMNRD